MIAYEEVKKGYEMCKAANLLSQFGTVPDETILSIMEYFRNLPSVKKDYRQANLVYYIIDDCVRLNVPESNIFDALKTLGLVSDEKGAVVVDGEYTIIEDKKGR